MGTTMTAGASSPTDSSASHLDTRVSEMQRCKPTSEESRRNCLLENPQKLK